jgi:hypothetical protein
MPHPTVTPACFRRMTSPANSQKADRTPRADQRKDRQNARHEVEDQPADETQN